MVDFLTGLIKRGLRFKRFHRFQSSKGLTLDGRDRQDVLSDIVTSSTLKIPLECIQSRRVSAPTFERGIGVISHK